MKLTYSLKSTVSFSAPVTGHVFRLRVTPLETSNQHVLDACIALTPETNTAMLVEPVFGNRVTTGRIDSMHRHFMFTSTGLVNTIYRRDQTPPQPYFLYPTLLTTAGTTLQTAFHSWRNRFTDKTPYQKALWLNNAIYDHFDYCPGATATTTTAESAFACHKGVCQDYTQSLIVLARLAGLPARYCAGLVIGTGQTHAWAELWTGQEWLSLDPTHNRETQENYVILSRGLDFETAAIDRGIFYGSALNTISQTIDCVADVRAL